MGEVCPEQGRFRAGAAAPRRLPVFQIAAVPFDDYDTLDVADGPRWLLVRLARHADRHGRCFPSMRTLAAAAKKSLATVCRWLKHLFDLGCFTRTREAGRVYHYTLAEAYRLRWRERPKPAVGQGVSPVQEGVSQRARQEADSAKHEEGARARFADRRVSFGELPDPSNRWQARVRSWIRSGGKFWLADWGPRPNEPGCFAPADLLQTGF
jgi:Helix-turn-helix domain